jgi:hypothetical protein
VTTFDRIIVISLVRRPDRLTAFRTRLGAAWPDGLSRLEFFPAVDGTVCPPPDWWRETPGAYGCWRSHQRVLEECLSLGSGNVLIFEDDASFCDCFELRLASLMGMVPSDWGQVYLGGQHLRQYPPEPVNNLVVRGRNVNRTHAYAVRGGERMRELYQWLHAGEHWKGKHHIDHHYGRLHKEGWPAYAPRDWLCGQSAGTSDVAARRRDPERWWPARSR